MSPIMNSQALSDNYKSVESIMQRIMNNTTTSSINNYMSDHNIRKKKTTKKSWLTPQQAHERIQRTKKKNPKLVQ